MSASSQLPDPNKGRRSAELRLRYFLPNGREDGTISLREAQDRANAKRGWIVKGVGGVPKKFVCYPHPGDRKVLQKTIGRGALGQKTGFAGMELV